MYALRGGFLIRPMQIHGAGAAGAVLSSWKRQFRDHAWIPAPVSFARDPGVAQVILSSIATSIMTVVSIVFAIPADDAHARIDAILAAHPDKLRPDRTTQGTLVSSWDVHLLHGGAARARTLPHPFVPVATVTEHGARAGLRGVADLFINHISRSIQR